MPEEQAFCVLVKIMYDYGLRDLYKNNFEDLHCKFYQLERLMQVSESLELLSLRDWLSYRKSLIKLMNNHNLWKFNGILQKMQMDLISDQYVHWFWYYKIFV